MIKIEALTLEQAYQDAAERLDCSVTELIVEVVQAPSSGFLGLFRKKAIIVATLKKSIAQEAAVTKKPKTEKKTKSVTPPVVEEAAPEQEEHTHQFLNDTMMPTSFVSDQDEELEEDLSSGLDYTADYDDAYDENVDEAEEELSIAIDEVAKEVKKEINRLFALTCFDIDEIDVSVYAPDTLLVEFSGEDAALLIGKEGYRYKALSYMIFNWINAKYNVQLRLEIAEFLKNQEESVNRYLQGVFESIDRDGRAQTKILDGVLVQIALRELRERYPDKYVAIRTTRDGLKYVIVNDYNY
jgi:spoIIIJ-associated protein